MDAGLAPGHAARQRGVIGLDDKDKLQHVQADERRQLRDYVTNPTFPALVQTLFPSAKAPTNFPRTDLVTVFLTGIKGLNQPTTVDGRRRCCG